MTATREELLVEIAGLDKSYGVVRALIGANFEVRRGEVMALLGENGAGKSTLVKVLSGLVGRDAGVIRIQGRSEKLGSPGAARSAGIAVVQQELSLVPTLSVVENVFLGSGLSGLWTRARLSRLARESLETVGVDVADWHRPVAHLSVAERQLIEVARLIARDARILIFDEPTATLSDSEIERVLRVVRRLADAGCGVVYVTHRLPEVFQIADRATIVREGRTQNPIAVSEVNVDQIVERMLGRPLADMYPDRRLFKPKPYIEISELQAEGLSDPLNLAIGEGEIVGLVGQIGSGAAVLPRVLGGVIRDFDGSIHIDGKAVEPKSVRRALSLGVAYCSPDRKLDGIFHNRSVRESLTAPAMAKVTPRGWYSARLARALSERLAGAFQISTERLEGRVSTLSGGNQQKVALGKWLGRDPRVLLVEEPTRGVDVGARAEIYSQLRELADGGLSVVFATSDLSEAMGLSDRVATFYRGKLLRVSRSDETSEHDVLRDVTQGHVNAETAKKT